MNKTEKYFEYRVSLRPKDLQVGVNNIVDERTPEVTLMDGSKEKVKWYLFKIPIKNYDKRVGAIRDFKTVRFMRMYMTDFRDSTVLRFGSFELVRGDWRTYAQDLSNPLIPPKSDGQIVVSSVKYRGERAASAGQLCVASGHQPYVRFQSASVASTERAGIVYEDNRLVSTGCACGL